MKIFAFKIILATTLFYLIPHSILNAGFTCLENDVTMQCCRKRNSPLQLVLFMAIYNLGQTERAALTGPLKKHLSWQYAILSFSAMGGIALLVIPFINSKNHLIHVNELVNKALPEMQAA